MKYFKLVLQYVYTMYAFAVFLLFMFVLFPFVILASLFGRIQGGNIVYHLCRFWADGAMTCWGMWHKNIYEAPHNHNHPVIFVFNHISYIDIPVILASFRNQPMRVLAKAEMAKIPVFGYIYKVATVMVDRSDSDHRAKSVEILKSILKRNISVAIAPEGTFNMTGKPLKEFYDGAFKIAIETQTPIKPVLFLDTYDRLNYHSVFSLTPGRSRSVFLEEVSVNGFTLNDVKELKQKVYDIMEAALIKYNASWIVEENKQ